MDPTGSILFTAGSIMTTEVVSVGPDEDISVAANLMESHRVSGLPVVDGQQRLLGVISEYDLLESVASLQMHGKVADFMSPAVAVATEESTLPELVQRFLRSRMRRLPVTRDGKLVGVISRRDLIFAGNVRQGLLVGLSEPEAAPQPVA